MAVTISVSIGAVDGERGYQLTTPDPKEAMSFLERYDHEGSSVSVTVQAHDEHAYTVLQQLMRPVEFASTAVQIIDSPGQ